MELAIFLLVAVIAVGLGVNAYFLAQPNKPNTEALKRSEHARVLQATSYVEKLAHYAVIIAAQNYHLPEGKAKKQFAINFILQAAKNNGFSVSTKLVSTVVQYVFELSKDLINKNDIDSRTKKVPSADTLTPAQQDNLLNK